MINILQLRATCARSMKSFAHYNNVGTEQRPLYFIDRGASVLAVAHLDTVIPRFNFCFYEKVGAVESGQLDDRLGVYLILHHLPRLIKNGRYDVLLTVDEEMCKSTAALFKPPRTYNWMFSFDRMLTDAVLYQYESDQLVEMLTGCGIGVGYGTYSDIVSMGHVGCSGINFGTGYSAFHHSPDAHAFLDDVEACVDGFLCFWEKYKDTHIPVPEIRARRARRLRHIWHPYEIDEDWETDTILLGDGSRHLPFFTYCELCGAACPGHLYINGRRLCSGCFASAATCEMCDELTVTYIKFSGVTLCSGCCEELELIV